jgi:hypothetical protein
MDVWYVKVLGINSNSNTEVKHYSQQGVACASQLCYCCSAMFTQYLSSLFDIYIKSYKRVVAISVNMYLEKGGIHDHSIY